MSIRWDGAGTSAESARDAGVKLVGGFRTAALEPASAADAGRPGSRPPHQDRPQRRAKVVHCDRQLPAPRPAFRARGGAFAELLPPPCVATTVVPPAPANQMRTSSLGAGQARDGRNAIGPVRYPARSPVLPPGRTGMGVGKALGRRRRLLRGADHQAPVGEKRRAEARLRNEAGNRGPPWR